MFSILDLMPVVPELSVLAMTCILLLVAAFADSKRVSLCYLLAQLTVIIVAALTLWQLHIAPQIALFDSFISDPLAQVAKLLIYALTFFVFLYSRDYIRDRAIPAGEFYVLSLFALLGMMVLVSAQTFLILYLGLELLSLPLYALVALQRDCGKASEAAMKYFVMGALASGMLLYGFSLFYGATGSLVITKVAHAIVSTPADQNLILLMGLVFVLVGFGFKLGAAPFHMWVPDVYHGAPTAVTMLLSSTPKIASLVMIIRLLNYAMPSLQPHWQQLWLVMALLSIGLGNVIAIAQDNLKRLFAYSAIAHIGYLSLGLVAGTSEGFAAAFFYVISYAIMSLGGFAMIVLLSRQGFEAEKISDFRGLHARHPWLALMMMLLLFSMAGLPPTVGFMAKLGVLIALVHQQQLWVAVVAMLFAVIGAYYYLRVVKTMYFDEPVNDLPITIEWDNRLAISINGGLMLLLGVLPTGLLQLCRAVF